MIQHTAVTPAALRSMIRKKLVCFGGNRKLKIYGMLSCASGKRMKESNRVFFSSEQEARRNGYRPCGHCLKSDYEKWKHEPV
ncbi:Ada metal-binding domain-containing protein [Flavihumibacter petaseus]|uniref:Ada metal-binding domain-containing protein n=1 Tax=Flavihumibacter petaseus TaxID=549295 RepID=UPI00061D267D|nr:Ada metal-binding domain-containing protein [Flavihumibacter petaseus]